MFAGLWTRIAGLGALIAGILAAVLTIRQQGKHDAIQQFDAATTKRQAAIDAAQRDAPVAADDLDRRLRDGTA